jgi:hypothetical protein
MQARLEDVRRRLANDRDERRLLDERIAVLAAEEGELVDLLRHNEQPAELERGAP